ncbi:Eukaryotic translation initiation factor 4B1 [Frankliniella fusca]|uniref:Eukaryotic translation initiation factor 4B1 n=1 Tax=Frankliniella fusca TaxID=407009 RepID=A0AAE1GT32_9NEOP|nr:Eukaryotic translation initiation factor 4B1 [Frankliniella fusca]KAK3911210.1 Eukaryotic translation initiation factor 4B1 [Frankliniella fusca]KAK3917857.1 Eukaryotic translation initiation factor 4B1 [Frankliniella fusca]KAK3918274.1 Eukaryotic translation initiation factor 4B1 [Frankliniella fusca]
MENSAAQVKQMGLVVHGQTCCQLAKRLERESCPPLSERGILLLGTNDILKGLPLNDFLRGMEKSIDLLLQKLDHITVLSFLLIPRLAAATNQTEHLKTLNSYNVIIRGLVTQNMASMKFIDIVPLFLGDGNEIKMELVKKDQLHLSDDAESNY